jgi:WD40 repeat protein
MILGLAVCCFSGCQKAPETATPIVRSEESQQVEKAATLPDVPSEAKQAAAMPEIGGADATPLQAKATPVNAAPSNVSPAAPKIASPTTEQIAQWTPAPYERLELLAIHEWEKTSFTSSVAALPDGKHFLVAGSRVILWSLAGDEPEHVFLELNSDDDGRDLLTLEVAPDGKWFAVGDSEGVLRMWRLDDRTEIATKKLDSNGLAGLAISPDGGEIATHSYDSEISIWSADSLVEKKKFKIDTRGLDRIRYAAPGLLAAAGETTSLWNTATGELVRELSPGRYSHAIARMPDDAKLVVGGDDSLQVLKIADWSVETPFTTSVSGRERIAFSPDGKLMATTNGGSVVIWNFAERRIAQIIDSFGWAIVGLAWLPETNLVVVASESGVSRIWGTPEAARTAGLTSLHKPLAMPDPKDKSPASPAQFAQFIDLRTLPTLPGSEPSITGPRNYSCTTTASAKEATIFYAYFLGKEGWKVAPADASSPPGAIEFAKDGFRLSLNTYDAGEGKIYVNLDLAGNYDLRWTPKFDEAPTEISYESASGVHYRTKADLLAIETWLLRKLTAVGWSAYTRLSSSSSETPDQRDLDFVKNGTSLRISIGKFPVAPDSYTISYSLFPNDWSAPIPPDSHYVEFDGSTEPALICTTNLSLDEAQKFYDESLAAEGWLVHGKSRSDKGNQAWLKYLRGQCNLTVGLTKLESGQTLVRIARGSNSLWDLSQQEDESAETSPEEPAAPASGLEAADFPVVEGAKPAQFDALDKSIAIQLDGVKLSEAAERYGKALAALGWEAEKGSIRDEDYTLITFAKGEQEITLRARSQAGNALVGFEGDGLLWTKELPVAKQTISYETWLRRSKLPAGLEHLDRYEAEMKAIR